MHPISVQIFIAPSFKQITPQVQKPWGIDQTNARVVGWKSFQIGTYAVLTNMGIYWDISWYIMRYTTQKNDFGSAWKRGIPWNAHFLQEKWCLLLIQHQISVTNFSAKPTSNFGGLGEHLSLIARNNRLILLFFIIFGLPSESSGAITSLCNPWLPAFVLVILLLKLYIYIYYIY